MRIRLQNPFMLAVAGTMLLAGCASDYGRHDGMHGHADWDARHMESHRKMMGHGPDAMCGMAGAGMGGPGMGMGMGGPGMGGPGMPLHGAGPGAMTTEQHRAMMAAHVKTMPPEVLKQRIQIMETQLQVMRDQLAAQPAAK